MKLKQFIDDLIEIKNQYGGDVIVIDDEENELTCEYDDSDGPAAVVISSY